MRKETVSNMQMRGSAAAVLTLLLILGGVGDAHASGGGAPEPAPEESEAPKYLFHMTAGNATYDSGVLTLESVYNETTVFTDRPEREAFPVHTMFTVNAMFAAVSAGDLDDDSFFVDPPNAAFSCALSSGELVRAVFVLRTPLQSDSAIAFDAEVLYASVSGAFQCDGPAVRFAFVDDEEEDIMCVAVTYFTCCSERGD